MKSVVVMPLCVALFTMATTVFAETAPQPPVTESAAEQPMPTMPCGRPGYKRGRMMGPGMQDYGPGPRGPRQGMRGPQMKQGMMAAKQEHMKNMEERLANIEALLKELVELEKAKQ